MVAPSVAMPPQRFEMWRGRELSGALSAYLRHGKSPDGHVMGVAEAQANKGWHLLEVIVSRFSKSRTFRGLQAADIHRLMKEHDGARQRFLLEQQEGKFWMRAIQGHSARVAPAPLAELFDRFDRSHEYWQDHLYHGTDRGAVEGILMQGLKTMERQCIHLSFTVEPAGVSGGVRGCATAVIVVDVGRALEDGYQFGYTARHAVVTEGKGGVLAALYISKAFDRWTGQTLYKADKKLIQEEQGDDERVWEDFQEKQAGGGRSFSGRAALPLREPSQPRRPEIKQDPRTGPVPLHAQTAAKVILTPRPGMEFKFVPAEGDLDFSQLGELVRVEKAGRVRGSGPSKLPDAITLRFITGSFLQGDKIGNGQNRDGYLLRAVQRDEGGQAAAGGSLVAPLPSSQQGRRFPQEPVWAHHRPSR